MRIVIATWGSHGDLNPALGLAVGLRDRGHDVVVATSPLYRPDVERAGVGFHAVRPDIDPGDSAFIARVMDAHRGTEFLFRQVLMPALGAAAADLRPAVAQAELVISHPATFAVPVLAEELGTMWASMVLAPMSFFSVHDVPVLPPAPWLRRIAERSPLVSRTLVAMARKATRNWTRPVAALRAASGLPAGGDPVYEGQHSPHLVLALFSRVLADPQADWPAHVVVTGAIPYNGAGVSGWPDALEAFLAAGPPPVVFTLGTSAVGAPGRFYEESIAAVRAVGCRAVLLVGYQGASRLSAPLPDAVIAVEYAPHAALFPRAAAVVHQGGAGTLHHALASGRPMIVVPFAHDQPDNADRARRLGVARVIRPGRYRARRVAQALREVLEDREMATAAAHVAARVRAEDGVGTACDAIERLLARQR
ncbi:Oleandomycin glycosyltransferase [Luteitalea pratensis]|uniref:Oleandomycin glycosyltransferase n=1 Tax=Luteitalea pratensis TaxID=1855912 RepID=A0A143PLG0_LUTPR|nr:glycosyltransferase [Luteitalea pratensis]AMY08609.1 Oleandomycin glycosyltransferase [Luteitalea pratensis]